MLTFFADSRVAPSPLAGCAFSLNALCADLFAPPLSVLPVEACFPVFYIVLNLFWGNAWISLILWRRSHFIQTL